MKTNYAVINEKEIQVLKSLISDTEKRTLEREFVLREIRKDLKKAGSALADTIDKNWKRFLELQALQMPHVIYNGKSTPTIVDWVKDPEGKFKLEKDIKQYLYTDDAEITVVEGCFDGRIVRESIVQKKEIIVYASGFEKEVVSLDKDGKPKTEKMNVTFVPKEKSTWGFTQVMVEAFIAAADDLLAELAAEENK